MTEKQATPVPFSRNSDYKVRYVEISKVVVGFPGEILKISALGSCVGLVIYPKNKTERTHCAVMGHIMLPKFHKKDKKKNHSPEKFPAKFADRAVLFMVSKLAEITNQNNNFEAKMAGGAKMFKKTSDTFDIGKENISATKAQLKRMGIPLAKYLTGGDRGMNITFNVETYDLVVTPTGGSSIIL
jgi:chemotaxis protein CheD